MPSPFLQVSWWQQAGLWTEVQHNLLLSALRVPCWAASGQSLGGLWPQFLFSTPSATLGELTASLGPRVPPPRGACPMLMCHGLGGEEHRGEDPAL